MSTAVLQAMLPGISGEVHVVSFHEGRFLLFYLVSTMIFMTYAMYNIIFRIFCILQNEMAINQWSLFILIQHGVQKELQGNGNMRDTCTINTSLKSRGRDLVFVHSVVSMGVQFSKLAICWTKAVFHFSAFFTLIKHIQRVGDIILSIVSGEQNCFFVSLLVFRIRYILHILHIMHIVCDRMLA